MRVHHVIGNHCLRAPVAVLRRKLKQERLYYAVTVHPGWKLFVLNSNDLGVDTEGEAQKRETAEFLEAHPLDSAPNMSDWNGGVASEQLTYGVSRPLHGPQIASRWLEEELRSAVSGSERVIVACHHPIGAGSAAETHMAWNAEVLESTLVESGVVVLVLCGHYHPGGYKKIHNTHFLTLQGALEAPMESVAYAVFHVSTEKIVVEGKGTVPERTLQLTS